MILPPVRHVLSSSAGNEGRVENLGEMAPTAVESSAE